MSVELLRRTVDKLYKLSDEFAAVGIPSGAAISLLNRARLIESHLAQGAADHKSITTTTYDLLDDWAECVDPASYLRKELTTTATELATSLKKKEGSGASKQAQLIQKIEKLHGDRHRKEEDREEGCEEEDQDRQGEEAYRIEGTEAVQEAGQAQERRADQPELSGR